MGLIRRSAQQCDAKARLRQLRQQTRASAEHDRSAEADREATSAAQRPAVLTGSHEQRMAALRRIASLPGM